MCNISSLVWIGRQIANSKVSIRILLSDPATWIKLIVAVRRHTATKTEFNIGYDNGLLPDGTKPLPARMLTYHCRYSLAFTWEQFHMRCSTLLIRNLSYTDNMSLNFYDISMGLLIQLTYQTHIWDPTYSTSSQRSQKAYCIAAL